MDSSPIPSIKRELELDCQFLEKQKHDPIYATSLIISQDTEDLHGPTVWFELCRVLLKASLSEIGLKTLKAPLAKTTPKSCCKE